MEAEKPAVPKRPARRLRPGVASVVVPLVIVLAATTAVAWVAIFGQPGAPRPVADGVVPAGSGSPTARPAPPTDGAAEPTNSEAPTGTCEQRTLAAPMEGRWVLHRAEFGSRGGHDYLRLKFRRDGSAGESVRMTTELIDSAEVAERHGQDPPAGAARTLVARFDGPVRIPGQFGGRGSGALGAFSINSRGGSTYVVAGINGDGCFDVDGGSWATGEPVDDVDITLLIAR